MKIINDKASRKEIVNILVNANMSFSINNSGIIKINETTQNNKIKLPLVLSKLTEVKDLKYDIIYDDTNTPSTMILSFELSMPNVGSWNGKWSGEASSYYLIHIFRKSNELDYNTINAQKILKQSSYYYNFGDGWGASVKVELITSAEATKRRKITVGFANYDWMVDSIIKNNKIIAD